MKKVYFRTKIDILEKSACNLIRVLICCNYRAKLYEGCTTKKDHLKISAEINGGCDASKIGASNSAYYKYKPGGGSYSGKYKFWYANSANGKYKIKKKYASATIFINLDDVEKTYAVFE